MSVTDAEVAEYHRFGPWIDEITVPEDVPRLFRSYPLDLAATRMVLKVPRGIARRDAIAGMDLYDHLVILDEVSLTLLSRRVATDARGADGDRPFGVLAIPLSDVVAMRDDLNLLDGRVTVSTSSGASIQVPYNGSSHDMATRLVNDLRAAARGGQASRIGSTLRAAGVAVAGPTAAPDPGHADTHLVSRFLELHGDNPDLTTWASHGSGRLLPTGTGLRGVAARAAHAVSPMTLHGSAILADATALELLGRHSSLVRGRDPVYSSSRLVVPFAALDRLELSPHPVYPDAIIATMGAGGWATNFAVPRDSPTERLLSTAAEPGPR